MQLRHSIVSATLLLGLLGSADVRADIPVPEPQTVWARDSQPSGQSIAYAGICLSAAIVAAGLIVARWPARGSRAGLIMTGVVTVIGLLVVVGGAWAAIQQAQRDRTAWKQWEIDENNRRSNWRGPPQFDYLQPLPESEPSDSELPDAELPSAENRPPPQP